MDLSDTVAVSVRSPELGADAELDNLTGQLKSALAAVADIEVAYQIDCERLDDWTDKGRILIVNLADFSNGLFDIFRARVDPRLEERLHLGLEGALHDRILQECGGLFRIAKSKIDRKSCRDKRRRLRPELFRLAKL